MMAETRNSTIPAQFYHHIIIIIIRVLPVTLITTSILDKFIT
jgi:hypothetical protein